MPIATQVALILALWCVWIMPATAAGYQVEVIIFAYAQPDADGEKFSPDPGLPGSEGLAQLGNAEQGAGPALATLSAASYRLNGVMGALRRGGKYRSLLHTSWLQPEGGRIRGVFLSAPAGSEQFQSEAERVMGSVRLRPTRFLHVDVDMAYFPGAVIPGKTGESSPAPAGHVRLQESRKIKFNEVHYFDHPLFGVLLQVSRAGGAADSVGE